MTLSKYTGGNKTIWIGTVAAETIPFDRILPIDAIITCDYGSDVQQIESQKDVFSWEKILGVRHSWNNFHLNYLIHGEAETFLLNHASQPPSQTQLLCFSSSGLLEGLLDANIFPTSLLCVPIEQKLYYDDKILLHHWLKRNNFDTLPTDTIRLGDLQYDVCAQQLGPELVVKLPVGSAGGYTFYVETESDLRRIQNRFPSATALIQTYRPGVPINIQGVIDTSITIAPPSVQLIGPKGFSVGRFDYCGNDFHINAYVPENLLNAALSITNRVALMMQSKGYRGIFGVDVLVDLSNDKVYMLEINPRFQSSTSLLTQLELMNNADSFLLEWHMASFGVNITPPRLPLPANEPLYRGATQIILHNLENRALRVDQSISAGIYRLDGDEQHLKWVRPGLTLLDCKTNDEFVITCGVPLEQQIIMPGAPLLRVQTFKCAFYDPVSRELTPELRTICDRIYDTLKFSEILLGS